MEDRYKIGQKGYIVHELTRLFSSISADEIDELVDAAKTRREAKQARRNDLGRLFDGQIATLKDRGVPAPIVEMLQNQHDQVIAKAREMSFENGHVPFLPVIPRAYLSIYSQMPMVKSGDKAGYTFLKPTAITDVATTPEDPYYIYDVENGESMRGKATQDAEKLIKKQNRLGLTEVEVISLGVHTDVLSRHYVDAVGSRLDSVGVLYLYLLDGRPELSWNPLGNGDSVWGAASCGSR